MAADRVSLENIEQLARACPDELGVRRGAEAAHRLRHQRYRVETGIGDAAGKDRHIGRRSALYGVDHCLNLFQRKERCNIERNAFLRQPLAEWHGALAARVGDWNLYANILAPGRDLTRLPCHIGKVVGEYFEGYRSIRNLLENLAGETLVITD